MIFAPLQVEGPLEGLELFLKILDSEGSGLIAVVVARWHGHVLSVHKAGLHHEVQQHHLIPEGFNADRRREFLAVKIFAE